MFANLATSIFVSSCNNNMYDSSNQSPAYLDVEFIDIASLTEPDWKVITEAACRMKFYVEDGVMKSDIMNASEINVSQRLFSILIDVIHATNASKIFSMPEYFMRSDGDPTFDCVAIALAEWGNHSYREIQDWITNEFGTQGVPLQELNRTVHNFYPNAMGSNPNDYIFPGVNWDATTTVGVFSVGNGYGHMANIIDRVDTNFIFRDGADTSEYIVPISQVRYVFYNFPINDTSLVNLSVNTFRKSLVK